MATPSPTSATVRRDGDALVFTGALLREAVAGVWREASVQAGAGVRRFDLGALQRVDSAGLALLAELAARVLRQARDGRAVVIDGSPAGLAELRDAYRLTPALAFGA